MFDDAALFLLEIQPAGRGKAEVFEYLRDERGIPPERVVAVGDANNDLSMLREAGLAIAMGNATAEVRQAADLVIGRNDESGLARWVEAGAPRSATGPAAAGDPR